MKQSLVLLSEIVLKSDYQIQISDKNLCVAKKNITLCFQHFKTSLLDLSTLVISQLTIKYGCCTSLVYLIITKSLYFWLVLNLEHFLLKRMHLFSAKRINGKSVRKQSTLFLLSVSLLSSERCEMLNSSSSCSGSSGST